MTGILGHPLFHLGLIIRLTCMGLLIPSAVQQWYGPFFLQSVTAPSLDPWTSYLAMGGDPRAFPYGYAMWFLFLPLTFLGHAAGLAIAHSYGMTLLLVDIGMLLALKRLIEGNDHLLLKVYWLSPVVLFATYWLGLNDLIPILLLIIGILELRDGPPQWAGVFMALAVSAKLSMILAVPFVLIYLHQNKRLKTSFLPFVLPLTVAMAALQLPYLHSPGGRAMLLGNPELLKIYDLAISFGGGLQIYILPLTYLLVLFTVWRVRRMSFELLLFLLGVAFLLVLLLTPASPGWFMWVIPFLVLYQAKSGQMTIALVAGFSLLYVGLSGILAPTPIFTFNSWLPALRAMDWPQPAAYVLSLWQTILFAAGIILAVRMLQEGVHSNEYFRLSRRPFIIGIAGDSGVGKDTLASSLVGLFGQHSVVHVSGDDYHLWDRRKPMWQVMTHLNPHANDLSRFAQDIISLANGHPALARHYDHRTGVMSKPALVQSNDFIVVSGLHALYLPILRSLYDLKIFIDMDEGLRRQLKLNRDVRQRGHHRSHVLATIERREADAEKYIHPQAGEADLVISIRPTHPDHVGEVDGHSKLRLSVLARQGMYYEDLLRVLIGVCGLHVEVAQERPSGEIELSIEGEVEAEDMAFAAGKLMPQLKELLDTIPQWYSGMRGLTQLIVLTHVTQSLRARLI
ncbi:uridine kinase [Nitrospira sp. CMX1]